MHVANGSEGWVCPNQGVPSAAQYPGLGWEGSNMFFYPPWSGFPLWSKIPKQRNKEGKTGA